MKAKPILNICRAFVVAGLALAVSGAFHAAQAAVITVEATLDQSINKTYDFSDGVPFVGGSDVGSPTIGNLAEGTDRNSNKRVLIYFPMPVELTGATVTSAFLKLTSPGQGVDNYATNGTSVVINVHRLTNGLFTEGSATTWDRLKVSPTVNWTASGGDFVATATFTSGNLFGSAGTGTTNWNVTADVQAFASGTTNSGWILIGPETTYAYDAGRQEYWGFYSSENANALIRPQLEITYVPEPTTFAMMLGGLGALAFLKRRNRR